MAPLIWINGPFGVGKTTAALELRRRHPRSLHFSPEWFGWFVHRWPPYRKRDYQDIRLWRDVNGVLAKALSLTGRMVIVPMTVARQDYLEDLTRGVADLRAVTLMASLDTITRRATERGFALDWATTQYDRVVAAIDGGALGRLIDTEDRTVAEVVDEIERATGLSRP